MFHNITSNQILYQNLKNKLVEIYTEAQPA